MVNCPTAPELIDAVKGFLRDDVAPELTDKKAFNLKVVLNLLETLKREFVQGDDAAMRELEGLRDLVGHDGTNEDLSKELCEMIRDGRMPTDSQLLQDELWRATLSRIAIDNPSYATYVRATSKGNE